MLRTAPLTHAWDASYTNDPDSGLTLNARNQVGSALSGVWTDMPHSLAHDACIPNQDPGEYYTDMTLQRGAAGSKHGQAATLCAICPELSNTHANGDALAPARSCITSSPRGDGGPHAGQGRAIRSRIVGDYVATASAPCQTGREPFFAHREIGGLRRNNKKLSHPLRCASLFRRLED